MQLFLASSLDKVKDIFVKKIGDIGGKRIGFISNPADIDREKGVDTWWVRQDQEMLESLGGIITPIDLRQIKHDELFDTTSKIDILYVSGGNTRYFKTLADDSGFQKVVDELIVKKGMTYISTSAGSCVMGTSIKHLDPGNFKAELGYGLINAMILPHWGSDSFEQEYQEVLMPKIYKENQTIITITDNQVLYVDNNGFNILGE